MRLLLVGLAGFFGTIMRYAVDQWISQRLSGAFPWGTFAINVSGSFLLGALFVLFTERLSPHPNLRFALMTGFLGAYTTFSTFALDTRRLAESGALGLAAANVVGSVALALLGVWLGMTLVRAQ